MFNGGSEMNCKPGDLAVYVGADLGLRGRFVTVVEEDAFVTSVFGRKFWIVDPPLPRDDRRGDALAVDDLVLRPIRDNDGQDETLTWAGLPNKQEQPA